VPALLALVLAPSLATHAALPTEYQAIVQMGGGDPLGDRIRPRAGRRRLPNGPRARSNIPWAASACDLTGFANVLEMEQKYLSPEELQRYEQSIGVYDPRSAGALPANQSPSRTGPPEG
jgi:hypothetical protein